MYKENEIHTKEILECTKIRFQPEKGVEGMAGGKLVGTPDGIDVDAVNNAISLTITNILKRFDYHLIYIFYVM
jgi:hypothetical protein